MKRVLVIILNYKTYQMTIDVVKQLRKLDESLFDIYVVDNCSPNEATDVLSKASVEMGFGFYRNDKNSGYAAGNNIGIRYAIEHGYEYSWILNNDVRLVDEQILKKMVSVLQEHPDIGCIGPQIIDADGNCCYPYVHRPSLWSMTLGLFAEKKKRAALQNVSGYVYRVHGCSMLLRNADVQSVGCLDERTFLFEEEEILAERLYLIQKKMYYCADTHLIHLESATIGRQRGLKSIRKIKIMNQSMDIYLTEYRHFNRLQRAVCKLFRDGLIFIRG